MSNEYPDRPLNSNEGTNMSSSSSEKRSTKIPSHVVNFKESKTHLFYVIQPDSETTEKRQNLVRIKVSKERPMSRKLVGNKMFLRTRSNYDVINKNEEKMKKSPRSNIASIHKRTDHPSFFVLPEVFSKTRQGNMKKAIARNQSTSDNSNETYVVRPKEENKTFGGRSKVPTILGTSMWIRNLQTVNSTRLQGPPIGSLANTKSEDYCQCDKIVAGKSYNKLDRQLPNLGSIKTDADVSARNSSRGYLMKDDLFQINFVKSSEENVTQRLRAGQDCERQYRECYICAKTTRTSQPTRPTSTKHLTDNYDSDASLRERNGHVKINFKLVRQCLISGSTKEKYEVLDAIRLRMKSTDVNLAMNTIEGIVKFDLFGVRCECRSKPLLEDLFWPIYEGEASYQLQKIIAQFVNALVSFKLGRNYFNNRSIIRTLIWGEIGRDNIEKSTGDNLVGIMTKLSYSRFQCSDMIKNGLLSWLVKHMEEVEYSLSKYHLQCVTALLRNLLRGCNLDNLIPIEITKLIVLLGRYLDTENATAKSFIYDSLGILFQNEKIVKASKELNFQRIIEDHLTVVENLKQKEHLKSVLQLLTGTSKSFSGQKFDIPLEEEPFLDVDLETDASGEIDYYPGECLLREKFSGESERHSDEKNVKVPHTDSTRKEGKLISRVFVEHLNSFLPQIEKNRIFPLCNDRCADLTRTCTHIGEHHPKKRKPYIPPNCRTPELLRRRPRNVNDSVERSAVTLTDESGHPTRSKISTISHDKTATKWKHYDGAVDNDNNLSKSSSMDADKLERIFLRQTMTTVEENEMFRSTKNPVSKPEQTEQTVNYGEDASELFEKTSHDEHLHDETKVDVENAENEEKELLSFDKTDVETTAGNLETKVGEEFQHKSEEGASTNIGKLLVAPGEMFHSYSDSRLSSNRVEPTSRSSHHLSDSEIRKTSEKDHLREKKTSATDLIEVKNEISSPQRENVTTEDPGVSSETVEEKTRAENAQPALEEKMSQLDRRNEMNAESEVSFERIVHASILDEKNLGDKENVHDESNRPNSDHSTGSSVEERESSETNIRNVTTENVDADAEDEHFVTKEDHLEVTYVEEQISSSVEERESSETNIQNVTTENVDADAEDEHFVTKEDHLKVTYVEEQISTTCKQSEATVGGSILDKLTSEDREVPERNAESQDFHEGDILDTTRIMIESENKMKGQVPGSKQKDNSDRKAGSVEGNKHLNLQTSQKEQEIDHMMTELNVTNFNETEIGRNLHSRSEEIFVLSGNENGSTMRKKPYTRSEDNFSNQKDSITTSHQSKSKSQETMMTEKLVDQPTTQFSEEPIIQHMNSLGNDEGLLASSQEVLTDRTTNKKSSTTESIQSLYGVESDVSTAQKLQVKFSNKATQSSFISEKSESSIDISLVERSLVAGREGSQTLLGSNVNLFKSSSDFDLLRSTRNSIHNMKSSRQLLARSEELVSVKQKDRHSTEDVATFEELKESFTQETGSGSSKSSVKRFECPDCKGSFYESRGTVNGPCDQCKVNLSKYRSFVKKLDKKVSTSATRSYDTVKSEERHWKPNQDGDKVNEFEEEDNSKSNIEVEVSEKSNSFVDITSAGKSIEENFENKSESDNVENITPPMPRKSSETARNAGFPSVASQANDEIKYAKSENLKTTNAAPRISTRSRSEQILNSTKPKEYDLFDAKLEKQSNSKNASTSTNDTSIERQEKEDESMDSTRTEGTVKKTSTITYLSKIPSAGVNDMPNKFMKHSMTTGDVGGGSEILPSTKEDGLRADEIVRAVDYSEDLVDDEDNSDKNNEEPATKLEENFRRTTEEGASITIDEGKMISRSSDSETKKTTEVAHLENVEDSLQNAEGEDFFNEKGHQEESSAIGELSKTKGDQSISTQISEGKYPVPRDEEVADKEFNARDIHQSKDTNLNELHARSKEMVVLRGKEDVVKQELHARSDDDFATGDYQLAFKVPEPDERSDERLEDSSQSTNADIARTSDKMLVDTVGNVGTHSIVRRPNSNVKKARSDTVQTANPALKIRTRSRSEQMLNQTNEKRSVSTRNQTVASEDDQNLFSKGTRSENLEDEMASTSETIITHEVVEDSDEMRVRSDENSGFNRATFDVTFNSPTKLRHLRSIDSPLFVRSDSLNNLLESIENPSHQDQQMTGPQKDRNFSVIGSYSSLSRHLSEEEITAELKDTDEGLHPRSNEMITLPIRKTCEKATSTSAEFITDTEESVDSFKSKRVADSEFPSNTMIQSDETNIEKQSETIVASEQMLTARALEMTRGETLFQKSLNEGVELSHANTSLLSPRSNEMVTPAEKTTNKDVTTNLTPAEKESSKQSYEDNEETQSTFSHEVFIEERILSSADGDEAASYVDKRQHKLRLVNSSCWRKLLDDDKLIEILSRKVFDKLRNEMHSCGPNCKSPCGGLNLYYKASESNQQNSK